MTRVPDHRPGWIVRRFRDAETALGQVRSTLARGALTVRDAAGRGLVVPDPFGGVARPHVPWSVATYAGDRVAVTADTFGFTHFLTARKQSPRLSITAVTETTETGTEGEWQVYDLTTGEVISDTLLIDGGIKTVSVTLPIPGEFFELSRLVIRVRRTLGTGTVSIYPISAEGVGSN